MKRYRIETIDGKVYEVEVEEKDNKIIIVFPSSGEKYSIRVIDIDKETGKALLEINGREVVAEYVEGGFIVDGAPGLIKKITEMPPLARIKSVETGKRQGYTPGLITAPLDGKIVSIRVKPGDTVEPETIIALIESMKMITELRAGVKGIVEEIYVEPGKSVRKGAKIAKIKVDAEKKRGKEED